MYSVHVFKRFSNSRQLSKLSFLKSVNRTTFSSSNTRRKELNECPSKKLKEKNDFNWKDRNAWIQAAKNTTRCLIGCSIGDFSAMYILQTHFAELPLPVTVGVSMASGILTSIAVETAALRFLNQMTVQKAFQTARTMSLISMLTMEASENAFGLLLSNGNMATMSWSVMIASMFVGWLTPLPYNYRQLKLYGKACH